MGSDPKMIDGRRSNAAITPHYYAATSGRLTRTAAGLYTLQWTGPSNVSSSVPNWLDTRVQVHSPAGTVYTGTVLSQSASTGAATLARTSSTTSKSPAPTRLIPNKQVVEQVSPDSSFELAAFP